MYQPYLVCKGKCNAATRHRDSGRVPVFTTVASRDIPKTLQRLDHFKLMFFCVVCGTERQYGNEGATAR